MRTHQNYLGKTDYLQSLELQNQRVDESRRDPAQVFLLGFEYEPVITLGRRANATDDVDLGLQSAHGIQIVEVSRGGQATLHSPGQLVIYPVCNIRFLEIPLKTWVCDLLKITQNTYETLAPNQKSALSIKGSGLYLGEAKLASLGLRIESGVSSFGLALNVNNDLGLFRSIRPCGVSGQEMAALGQGSELGSVFSIWCAQFEQHYRTRIVDKNPAVPHFDDSSMRP